MHLSSNRSKSRSSCVRWSLMTRLTLDGGSMLRGAQPVCTRGPHAPAAGLVVSKQRNVRCCSAENSTGLDHAAAKPQQSGNLVVAGIVSAMTESLHLLGIGQQRYQHITQQPPVNQPLQPGDIAGMISRITEDYQRAYFVTGVIDDSIYDSNCTFADPTVKFSGMSFASTTRPWSAPCSINAQPCYQFNAWSLWFASVLVLS
eukprot:GHUV01020984.1.p1 GENE.GHUV01020984.1~~GHUV01020984.1.p1  ORF type:complete len:202 (+),score=24.19 GHUV01020984.1:48-653(+)